MMHGDQPEKRVLRVLILPLPPQSTKINHQGRVINKNLARVQSSTSTPQRNTKKRHQQTVAPREKTKKTHHLLLLYLQDFSTVQPAVRVKRVPSSFPSFLFLLIPENQRVIHTTTDTTACTPHLRVLATTV